MKVLPNFFNTNSVLQHLNKNFQNLTMPSKDTAVDRLHVSSNQRKQGVLASYMSTEKCSFFSASKNTGKRRTLY
jgi:hypothetical protein